MSVGTRLVDEIDFEPPGGMLGLILNTAAIEKDLLAGFIFRDSELRAIFTKK